MSWARCAALLGCLCVLAGCKRAVEAPSPPDAEQAVLVPVHAAPDAGQAATNKRSGARAKHPAPHVKSVSPEVPGVVAGEALPAQDVVLSSGQELVLDFSAGARVRLLGASIVRSEAAQQDALLVRAATLSVDLAPAAATPDSGLLLTTPSAAFSLVRSGRFALRSFENGSSVALVVAGTVAVSTAIEARGSVGAQKSPGQEAALKLLSAGEKVELRLDGSVLRSRHPLRTLEEAEKAAAALSEPKLKESAFAALDQSLTAALDALRGALLREQELSTAHRAALALPAGGDAQRMELQAQLAAHAATLSRARRRLETALAQRAASRLNTARGSEDRLSAEALELLAPAP